MNNSMKSQPRANQIRMRLIAFADIEIKSILKTKPEMNNPKQKNQLVDFEDYKIEFEEMFASSCHECFNNEFKQCTDDNTFQVINYNKKQARKRSIKLLYSICSSLKPIATLI